MYEVSRKLWFALYGATWLLLAAAFGMGWPAWLAVILSGVALAVSALTLPSPRNARARYVAGCDCRRCARLATRHTRRRTDGGEPV